MYALVFGSGNKWINVLDDAYTIYNTHMYVYILSRPNFFSILLFSFFTLFFFFLFSMTQNRPLYTRANAVCDTMAFFLVSNLEEGKRI